MISIGFWIGTGKSGGVDDVICVPLTHFFAIYQGNISITGLSTSAYGHQLDNNTKVQPFIIRNQAGSSTGLDTDAMVMIINVTFARRGMRSVK